MSDRKENKRMATNRTIRLKKQEELRKTLNEQLATKKRAREDEKLIDK